MTTGYVLDRWVELSQTFIASEIAELRRQGADVAVLALHRSGGAVPDGAADVASTYLRDSPSGLLHLRHHLRWLLRGPSRYARFLIAVARHRSEAAEMAWKRLPWAASELEAHGVTRLHAHFAWAGASAARSLSALTGWPWALTVHARDILVPRPRLSDKLEGCDLLVTVCHDNLRVLRSRYGLQRPVEIVVCGVTIPASWVPPPPEVDVVAVGRLVPKKGFDLLLRAVAEMTGAGREVDVVVVGEGPERTALESLRDEIGVQGAVRLAGALPHAEVLDLIGRSRVLALPARVAPDGDADATPLVVKEAMARQVPVVVTDVGGLPELVDDEVGALVRREDPPALAAALVRLLDDDSERVRRGKAARARAAERADVRNEVARLRLLLGAMA